MTGLPSNDCQIDDLNNSFPTGIESLRFPLDNSLQVLYTGYFNGFGVEVRAPEEMSFLFHMGCFGKGSKSRSKPKISQSDGSPSIMRRRQFFKRNYWYKKFENSEINDGDTFFKDVNDLIHKIVNDSKKQYAKEVIDLVSSDDEMVDDDDNFDSFCREDLDSHNDSISSKNITVVVPNSDSENENYFSNMKPESCLNKIHLVEKLMLTLQEAFFLIYGLGCLRIENLNGHILTIKESWELFSHTELNFLEKYIVYHYFRSKGYIVKPGIKFGGDYLLYKEGPGVSHADYIVVINFDQEKYEWTAVLGHMRMANTTAKEVLIAEVTKPTNQDSLKFPDDLNKFKVREVILTRHLPVTINNDED